MYNFETEFSQFNLDIDKIHHVFESSLSQTEIEILESDHYDKSMSDSEKEIYYKEAVGGLVGAVINTIQEIINSIHILIQKLIVKVTGNNDVRKKLEAALVADVSKVHERVEVYHTDAAKAQLDAYIREMAKLERRLLNTKFTAYHDKKHPGVYPIEAQQIYREMEKLEAKYNPRLLEENAGVVKMALKDAVRFSLNDLDKVKVDYNEVERGSKEVLTQFKRDASGCETPIQANMLEKMSMGISSKVRQYADYRTRSHTKSIGKTLACVAAGIAAGAIVMKAAGKVGGLTIDQLYQRNPTVNGIFNDIAAKMASAVPGTNPPA